MCLCFKTKIKTYINAKINCSVSIYLWVYKNNINAISLYKKMNFEILNEMENKNYMKYSQ